MKIYPSVLETTAEDLIASITRLIPHFDYFQLDIADGLLVPNTTIQISDIQKIMETPPWDLSYTQCEFHLMVQDYMSHFPLLEEMPNLYIRNVLIHLKALQHTYQELSDQVSFELGIVLNPEEGVEENWERIQEFPIIMLMMVNPGYQGARFMPEQLDKITQLREKGYEGEIILDGGINEESMKIIVQKPQIPDAVCPGSYFRVENVAERLESLETLVGVPADEV